MFHDIQNQLMVKQTITTAAAVSTDVYDLGKEGADISIGEAYSALFVPTTAATGGATYTLEVIQSSASGMSSPDVLATRAIAAGVLTVDTQFILSIPQGAISKRYLAFRVTPAGGTTPSVVLSAFLVPDKEIAVNKYFAKVYETL